MEDKTSLINFFNLPNQKINGQTGFNTKCTIFSRLYPIFYLLFKDFHLFLK